LKFKEKLIFSIFLFALGTFFNIFASSALHTMLTEGHFNIQLFSLGESIDRIFEDGQNGALFLCLQGFLVLFCVILVVTNQRPYQSKQLNITDSIKIPVSAGQGQHGTACFMSKSEKGKRFQILTLIRGSPVIQSLLRQGSDIYREAAAFKESNIEAHDKHSVTTPDETECAGDYTEENSHLKRRDEELRALNSPKNTNIFPRLLDKDSNETYFKEGAGVVVGMEKTGLGEKHFCLNEDVHSLIIGMTRCGKTRCLVIPTICALALAGESIVISDPKGELYCYTSRMLRRLGYEVDVLDFQTPRKSYCFNPLQRVIDAVNDNNLDLAQTYAWDLVCFLVEKSERAEPIWQNGEMAVLAAGILCVVFDNKDNPQYQNMTNVYWFLSEMCRDIKVGTSSFKPIVDYVKGLPDTHPAKPLLGIANVAPSRTAGSFYTSALATLRLFTSKEIYNITRKSDFSLDGAGNKKQALFFILPDEKTTYYPIVTLIVSQMYELLVQSAKKQGNRLPNRVNFILDEFGNFSSISDFNAKLTVGGGYGLRFSLFVQEFNQLIEKYGRDKAAIIRGNCCVWVYLAANDCETLSEIEKRLGEYTVSTYSLGGSTQKYMNPSSNQNSSLQGRKLLFASELGKLERPHQIVIVSGNPAVMYAPDLSEWLFNEMLGLGDKEHNKKYIMQFQENRPDIAKTNDDVALWGIWKKFNQPGDRIRRIQPEFNNGGDY
jgi:type IV secretion system protein VirD4